MLWLSPLGMAMPGGDAWAQALLAPGSSARVQGRRGGSVNVRAEPTTDSNVVAQAERDDLVLIFESVDQGTYVWHKVRSVDEGFEGWIREDLLSGITPPAATDDNGVAADQENDGGAGSDGNRARVEAAQLESPGPDEAVPERRAVDQWVDLIVDNVSAIDGCSSVSSAPPIKILQLYEANPSVMGVIFLDSAGRSWDCIISTNARTPRQFSPAGTTYRLISRRSGASFIRTPQEPPEDECIEAEEVVDESQGVVVGYLLDEVC